MTIFLFRLLILTSFWANGVLLVMCRSYSKSQKRILGAMREQNDLLEQQNNLLAEKDQLIRFYQRKVDRDAE